MKKPSKTPVHRIAAMRRADSQRRTEIAEQLIRVEDAMHATIDDPTIARVSRELASLRELVNHWPVMI